MKCLAAWIVVFIVLPMSVAAQPVSDPTDLDSDGIPGLAEPVRPTSQPPSALAGSGTLLIDRTHRNSFNVSGFSSYIADQGWIVLELTVGPVTQEALEGADIFLVPTRAGGLGPIDPFSTEEIAAVQTFLAGGNGLWVPHDNVDPSGVNTLATAFGVTFKYDYIQDPSNNEGELVWPTIHLLAPHAVTDGVTSYGYYGGDCIGVASPAEILASGDEDAYSLYCPAGTLPPTLAVWESEGRAVFSGDITPLHPNYYEPRLRPEEQLLLQNIANWLLGPPPNAVESKTWGRVKATFR
jgi:hypothetical protein